MSKIECVIGIMGTCIIFAIATMVAHAIIYGEVIDDEAVMLKSVDEVIVHDGVEHRVKYDIVLKNGKVDVVGENDE